MKFLISFLLMALLAFSSGLIFPWWTIAVACFVVALFIPMHPWYAFLCGFGAMAVLWGGMAFYLSYGNEHILAGRLSDLILKSKNPYLLIAITGLTGGLVGGLSSLSASWLRKNTRKKN